jgi:nucleoid-associated protein YgaU
MKSFLHSPLVLTLFSLLLLHTSPLFGQATTEKVKKIPFHGKIEALDAGAKTITLNGKSARVLHVISTTKIIDGNSNPTTFSTAAVGEAVSGSYEKDTMGLFTLRIGAKTGSKGAASVEASDAPAAPAPAASTAAAAPAAAPAPATVPAAATTKAKKGSFSGSVTAVDATASTFTIKSRTFTVDSSSKVTDATGAASSLASVAVGTKVRGTYEKSADGATMTVVSLKIAK